MKIAKILLISLAAASLALTACGKKYKQVDTIQPAPGYVEYGK